MKDIYVTMYKTAGLNVSLRDDMITIPVSDIVSVTFIHNYDIATYPVIRFRIYSDLDKIQTICEHPDTLNVTCVLQGGIYKMNNDDEKNPVLLQGTDAVNITGSGYIENKNIVSSSYDKYEQGESKTSNLNDNIKEALKENVKEKKELLQKQEQQKIKKILKRLNRYKSLDLKKNIINNDTPLHYAAATNQLDCLKMLVEIGHGNINAMDYFRKTPLMCA